ncbi:MAG TPA: SIS domain-containing protein [Candidatus Limnocylindria bacterium]|nr:SIS domain-containing protein [Candidatus Limnocylindria bacterium]
MSLRSEIAEQPTAAARLIEEGAAEALRLGGLLARAKHVTVVARGSSDNAATYGKYLLEGLARIVTASAAPSLVTRYGTPPRYSGGAVIGISQSGAAPDVSAVIAAARRDGALTVAITNRAASALGRAAEHVFELRCGPERAIAATKTYTTSCIALAMLAGAAAGRPLELAPLPDALREAVESEPSAARIARRIGRSRALVVLGRGYAYAAALEAALKIKELARVWAEPYSSADFAHGPRALLERGTPVLLLAARGATERETRSLATSLRRRGAKVYAITDDAVLAAKVDDAVLLRRAVGELLSPIALVVAAQHVAAHVARHHGRDPEKPAGLSKVTRTL